MLTDDRQITWRLVARETVNFVSLKSQCLRLQSFDFYKGRLSTRQHSLFGLGAVPIIQGTLLGFDFFLSQLSDGSIHGLLVTINPIYITGDTKDVLHYDPRLIHWTFLNILFMVVSQLYVLWCLPVRITMIVSYLIKLFKLRWQFRCVWKELKCKTGFLRYCLLSRNSVLYPCRMFM